MAEDAYTQRIDRCISDSIIKIGGGFTVGCTFSMFMTKKRLWPVMIGLGIGMGISYSNCQKSLNEITKSGHTGELKLDH